MVARQIDDAGALARLAQKLLHDVVMMLRPEPAGTQLPAIDDIADQIDRVGIVVAQEIEKMLGLTAARAEMHIGNKERTELDYARARTSPSVISHLFQSNRFIKLFHCRTMTAIVNAATHRAGNSRTGKRVTGSVTAPPKRSADDSADSRRRDILHHRHRRPAHEHRDRDWPLPPQRAARAAVEPPPGRPISSRQPRAPALRNRQLCRRYAVVRRSISIIRITKSCSASLPQRIPSCRSSRH